MTTRERFLSIVHFETPDYVPYWYPPGIGIAHKETVERWVAEEGYPSDYDSIVEFFGAEGYAGVGLHTGFVPDFPVETEDLGDGYVLIRQHKATTRELANNWDLYTMPEFRTYMFEDRRDFEEHMRPRLDPAHPDRPRPEVPAEQPEQPLAISCPSYFGVYRSWFGLDRISYLMHDDPKLLHEMSRAFTDLFLDQAWEVARKVQVDAIIGWEDMCYRSGMLISPAAFDEFCAPYYREVADFARRIGAAVVDVDCDGDITEFVHCLWRSGVNMCHAFEPTHGGSDVLRIRAELPRFIICGGIDKHATVDPDPAMAIAEVDAKVPPLVRSGGYLPSIDHGLPPICHYRPFWHMMDRIRQHCGAPPAPFQEAGPP
ncbi:MAG TPA: uroporphyrinogen decarboxylase family protein [Armatimonadota bacterium]|nr:uroporphyrinogen decarboxylase family protein [Armatimonadota bacterium]